MARFALTAVLGITLALTGFLTATAVRATAQSGPSIVTAYQSSLSLTFSGTMGGSSTQMAWGPDGRLYVHTNNNGVWSYIFNEATGQISDPIQAVNGLNGIGIAFHGTNEMYLSIIGPNHLDSIYKLTGPDQNGVWGNTANGDVNVAIVTGIPVGDHDVDQIQIVGDTLYVGIGPRTINEFSGVWTSGSLDDYGGAGFWSGGIGNTFGDCVYGGTISMIKNLNHVVNATGSCNAFSPNDTWKQEIQQDTYPYKLKSKDNKLVIHSAGTRNPFGLCLDQNNNLYFTVNFNRVHTMGNGQSGFGLDGDVLDSDFATMDVHDQLFLAVAGGDYGYHSANWANRSPYLMRREATHVIQRSITFDNLYNTGPFPVYNPAEPDGLGPSSSADGCGFWYNTGLPAELYGNIFIVRYNSPITEVSPGTITLTYSDLVSVDVTTGTVRQIATGFANPLTVLPTQDNQYLLIGDYGDANLYAIKVN